MYILGAGIEPVIGVLDASGGLPELVVIGHELTDVTRSALREGALDAVITQDVGHLVRSALRVLRAKTDLSETIPSQERIRIEIVLKENMPSESGT